MSAAEGGNRRSGEMADVPHETAAFRSDGGWLAQPGFTPVSRWPFDNLNKALVDSTTILKL